MTHDNHGHITDSSPWPSTWCSLRPSASFTAESSSTNMSTLMSACGGPLFSLAKKDFPQPICTHAQVISSNGSRSSGAKEVCKQNRT